MTSEDEIIFQLKLSSVGTNFTNGTYEKFKDENPLKLVHLAVKILCDCFIRKEERALFHYHLACLLLNGLNGVDKDELMKSIEIAKENCDGWRAGKSKTIGDESREGR